VVFGPSCTGGSPTLGRLSAAALILVASASFLGAGVQGVYGFGFALVAAPLLAAVLQPQEAVALLAVAGIAVSGTVLLAAPRSATGDEAARAVLPWALAGLPLGGLLWLVPDDPVRIGVCVASLASAALMLRAPDTVPGGRSADPGARSLRHGRAVGLLTGALTTSTGTNGPPLVLAFAHAGLDAVAMRRALAICFLALGFPAVSLLVALGGAAPDRDVLLAGGVGAAAGVLAAIPVRGRLPEHRFRRDVLLIVVAASSVGLAVVLG